MQNVKLKKKENKREPLDKLYREKKKWSTQVFIQKSVDTFII